MLKKSLFVLGLLLLLTACSGIPLSDEMDLLQAPMLNLEQKAVYQALETTLNTSEINYQYPHTGKYRTPFAFYDLDGDGTEEAIVFYSEKESVGEIFAKVLKQDSKGEWYSFRDLAGHGDQVSFIDFAPMVNEKSACLVIGWERSDNPRENYLGVYSIHEESDQLNLQKQDILEPYDEFDLHDYDDDGLFELLLARKNSQNRYELVLIKEVKGKVSIVDRLELNPDTFTILQMIHGNLWGNRQAVFIDQRIQEQTSAVGVYYGTEVVEVDGNRLELIVGYGTGEKTQSNEYYDTTLRFEYSLSADLWNNGTVCVPRVGNLPGVADSDDKKIAKLTEYRRLTQSGFHTLYNTVVNTADGYLILLPERWIGTINVVQYPENREWRIHKFTSGTGESSTELFRIRVHGLGDFIDPSSDADIVLAERGQFTYYGYVPETTGEELAITTEEAKEMFALIGS